MAIQRRKILRPDSKGRITLGKLAENVSGFEIAVEKTGRIILFPQVEIPVEEAWLYKNKDAIAGVMQGIDDVKEGKIKSRGSFAEYLKQGKE
jgi:hypothetical protein